MSNATPPKSARAAKPLAQIPKPLVLVVEADEDSREMLKVILEIDGGFEVLEFEHAEQAMARHKGVRPALAIVNIGFNEVLTIKQMREHPTFRELPIIVTSANALPSYRNRAMSAGCDQFFTKPYDSDKLILALKVYLADEQ